MALTTAHSYRRLLSNAYRLSDLLALLIVLGLIARYPTVSATDLSLPRLFDVNLTVGHLIVGAVLSMIHLLIFQFFGLYAIQNAVMPLTKGLVDVSKSIAASTLFFIAAGRVFNIALFDLANMLMLFLPLSTILTWLLRRMIRFAIERTRLGDQHHWRVIILGTGEQAISYAEQIVMDRGLGLDFLGYLGEQLHPADENGKYLGQLGEFRRLVGRQVIDEVIVCMPIQQHAEEVREIIRQARDRGIVIRVPLPQLFRNQFDDADWARITHGSSKLDAAGAVSPDLVIHSGYQIGWGFFVKRILDLLIASLLILLTSPIMLIAMILVAISSPGPVFFTQQRYGFHGRIFDLYKFRTMVRDAEAKQAELIIQHKELNGPGFKMKNDPRVTRVGHWLRKTSIDELPQLFNVLKGEMSLVGPRPLPLSDYRALREQSSLRRLSVLPGLTCYWQVSGRNELPFQEWMKLDMEYVDNWNLWTDIRILLKTVPAVLKGKGAS